MDCCRRRLAAVSLVGLLAACGAESSSESGALTDPASSAVTQDKPPNLSPDARPELAEMLRETFDEIVAASAQHLVLFFPEQHLTPDEHIGFGRLFGRLEGHPNLALDAERPEFFELRAVHVPARFAWAVPRVRPRESVMMAP